MKLNKGKFLPEKHRKGKLVLLVHILSIAFQIYFKTRTTV